MKPKKPKRLSPVFENPVLDDLLEQCYEAIKEAGEQVQADASVSLTYPGHVVFHIAEELDERKIPIDDLITQAIEHCSHGLDNPRYVAVVLQLAEALERGAKKLRKAMRAKR